MLELEYKLRSSPAGTLCYYCFTCVDWLENAASKDDHYDHGHATQVFCKGPFV